MNLAGSVRLGERTAPGRLMFGPHETNLGDGRAISERHVAYYRRRAAGGAGIVVIEEASVHDSDWPYERAPLASQCREGWAAIAEGIAGTGSGSLVLAALGHSGGQGSSAYSQQPLLAPSRVPEVHTREVPKWMEPGDIAAVVRGFEDAAATAVASGLDGVEVNAGQHSLVRQFLSGLTNQRDDAWGEDRLRFATHVLMAARQGLERDNPGETPALLGLRLSCDELAPWAGLTPEAAVEVAVTLSAFVDYLVVVRGSIFTASATRPDMHETPMFNRDLCSLIRRGVRDAGCEIPVVLQGSVVDPTEAQRALDDHVCDLVEMTRAQIADPALGAKVRLGVLATVRPCTLCNQLCQVRDVRNPIVSCIAEPSSGHELDDPAPVADLGEPSSEISADSPAKVLIIGGGPAGLEAARIAALLGVEVHLVEQRDTLGGQLGVAARAVGRQGFVPLLAWWRAELQRLGVAVTIGESASTESVIDAHRIGSGVILAIGSRDGEPHPVIEPEAAGRVVSAAAWLQAHTSDAAGAPESPVVVLDPIGGPIGVSVAETLASEGVAVHLVTQDHLAGNELARSGDLASANVRLQQLDVTIQRRSIVRTVRANGAAERLPLQVVVEDRFTGERRAIDAALVIDAGFRLPDESFAAIVDDHQILRAGDAVAPRTVHEAVLEGRRAVQALFAGLRT